MDLTIDEEFKDLIPQLTFEEFIQLEKNCLEQGIRDKIIVWPCDNELIIVDGMNRYVISQKHSLPFEITEVDFPDKTQAKRWMIVNQIGRRNITIETRNYLIGKLYSELKLDKLDNLLMGNWQRQIVLSEEETQSTTAQEIADKYKVSEKTVRRSEQFANAIDHLEKKFGSGLKNKILNRELDLTQQDTLLLSKLEEEKQKTIATKLINGDAKTLRDAKIQAHFDTREKEVQSSPITTNNNFEYNKIYLGSAPDVLKTFPDNICDCCIFDPPYGVEVNFDKTLYPDFNDSMEYAMNILEETCEQLVRILKPNAHLYVFFAMHNFSEVKAILSKYFEISIPIPLIWVKNTNGKCNFKEVYAPSYEPIWYCCGDRTRLLNRNLSRDVLIFNSVPSQFKLHYAEKPVELLKYLIENSTIENEVVLDCFAGSSSTLRAAKELKRRFLGVEISEDIYRIGLQSLIEKV
jgi:DNA modification methylase